MHCFSAILTPPPTFQFGFCFIPDTQVYPAMGNHDFHPKNQLPAENNTIYNGVVELWHPWLSNSSVLTFKEGTWWRGGIVRLRA